MIDDSIDDVIDDAIHNLIQPTSDASETDVTPGPYCLAYASSTPRGAALVWRAPTKPARQGGSS